MDKETALSLGLDFNYMRTFSSLFSVSIFIYVLLVMPVHAQVKERFDTIKLIDVTHHVAQSGTYLEESNYPYALHHAQTAKRLSILEDKGSRYAANLQLGTVCFLYGSV
jgi:hypothetical protein